MSMPVTQCRFIKGFGEAILAGLDDSHRALEPHPGAKTAGWLVGHMCVTGDFARKLCGRDPLCPKEWRALFNPGTQPSRHSAVYPPMADLVARFKDVYADLCEAAAAVDNASLERPNPVEFARAAFPTAGHFLPYLMTGHLAYHLGQLAAWRHSAGLGRAEGPQ